MARKKKWMQKAARSMKRRGTVGVFGAKAKRAGMTTRAYASKVLANKSRYSAATVKQANFARNAMKSKRKKKR
jgi:hypothetical protein